MNLRLKGKSLKGKNRIRELGEDWILEKAQEIVLFESKVGPWLLVSPVADSNKSRWIHATDDKDFEVCK